MAEFKESLEDRAALAGKHAEFAALIRGVEAGTVHPDDAYSKLTQDFEADSEEASEFLNLVLGVEGDSW